MRRLACGGLVLFCGLAVAGGQNADSLHLPLTRVVLYKSGIGYFEYSGAVSGDRQVEINLTTSQLNDVLKSLTALDLNGGRITGASYNSATPAAQQLAALSLPFGPQGANLPDLLQNLRGAALALRTRNGAFTGRLLGVARKANAPDEATLTLLGEKGELRSFDLSAVTGLRLLDTGLQRELDLGLNVLDAQHAEDTRRLLLTADGSGTRQVEVSYISEVPVWKTTYRIVLPASAGAKPLLQGWAVVDNTIGEDWSNVALTLASGAPQSFIQQLSQPLYTRRPSVPLPQGYLPTPQLQAAANNHQTVQVVGAPMAAAGFIFAGSGGGGGGGGRGGGGFGGNADMSPSMAQSVMPANAGELGDLFEYTLRDRVTIPRNQSALVPILQSEVTADKVSLWSDLTPTPTPLRALWLTNSSGLVLDAGSVEIVDGDTFGGEALMAAVEPGERRLITYAADLALRVGQEQAPDATGITHVTVANGTLTETEQLRQHTDYTVSNSDTAAHAVVLECVKPASGWELAATMQPAEETPASDRFQFTAAGKVDSVFAVRRVRHTDQTLPVGQMSADTVDTLSREHALTPTLEAALRGVVAARAALDARNAEILQMQSKRDELVSDQQRLTGNLAGLVHGSAEERTLAARYARALGDDETQLAQIDATLAGAQIQARQAAADFTKLVNGLAFDVDVDGTLEN